MGSLKASLVLETGKVFTGRAFGAVGKTFGEVVFCTALTGYQEILTDPSYQRQIVVMTYPHIGNYGTHPSLNESRKPFVSGFVAREFSSIASHWQSTKPLMDFMKKNKVIGIEDIDTRALTKHLRTVGVCRGVIATGNLNPKTLLSLVKKSPEMSGADLVKEVTCKKLYTWKEKGAPPIKRKVVVMDFGVKFNILRSLVLKGCEVQVVPASTSTKEILAMNPSGVMLSNGPGDPSAVSYAVETVRGLVDHNQTTSKQLPVFGICLGHQVLGQALGGKTFKLKFGHRGANHPVKDVTTGKVEVTTQNHGFAVDIDSLAGKQVELTHINLNDQTLEGLRHKQLPVFSVQHHPEAYPGPHDSHYLFDRFMDCIDKANTN